MSATKAPHAYKTFFIASLPSSSELEYYGFYGPNSVTLQQQSGRNIRFLGAMLNTQKVPAALRRALHKRDLFPNRTACHFGSSARQPPPTAKWIVSPGVKDCARTP
jgi:hypothetical protein